MFLAALEMNFLKEVKVVIQVCGLLVISKIDVAELASFLLQMINNLLIKALLVHSLNK